VNYLNPFQQYACWGPNGWPYWRSADVRELNRVGVLGTAPDNHFVSIAPNREAYVMWRVDPTSGATIIVGSGEGEIQLPNTEPECERFYRLDRPYTWGWVGLAALLGGGLVYGLGKALSR